MSIKRKIKDFMLDNIDKFVVFRNRRNEMRKYSDPRRKNIYEKIKLTADQKKSIDTLYKNMYGKKIPYVWHKNFTAHSNKFDVNYFPELLYIPEFEHFMNPFKFYAKALSDKNVLPHIAKSSGVAMPKTIVCCCNNMFLDNGGNNISKEEAISVFSNCGNAFIKPSVDTTSGKGCLIVNMENGKDLKSGKSAEEIIEYIGKNFVIQEVLVNHKSLSDIYPHSVNTFRVITYRWKDDVFHMPVILRIGQGGSYLDNAHAGGMFIAVDDDGKLHDMAITEFNQQFTVHPDTGFVFSGAKIDMTPEVIKCAKKMHCAIPQLGVINWDFTLDSNGVPTLIEANLIAGSVWLPQMAHGCGPFGERTEEVLEWLRFMKKLPKKERANYLYGKTF